MVRLFGASTSEIRNTLCISSIGRQLGLGLFCQFLHQSIHPLHVGRTTRQGYFVGVEVLLKNSLKMIEWVGFCEVVHKLPLNGHLAWLGFDGVVCGHGKEKVGSRYGIGSEFVVEGFDVVEGGVGSGVDDCGIIFTLTS